MRIRPATPGDAAAIAAILLPVLRDTTITFSTRIRSPEEIAESLTPSHLVAEAEGTVLGFAHYFPFRQGPGYRFVKEHSIVLAPQARGRGTGRALMEALQGHACAEGVTSLFAGVSGENVAGIAFHRSLGFETVAHLPEMGHKFGRWIDLVLMRKML